MRYSGSAQKSKNARDITVNDRDVYVYTCTVFVISAAYGLLNGHGLVCSSAFKSCKYFTR